MLFAVRIGLIAGLATLVGLSCLSVLSGHAVKQGLEELEIARFRYLVSSLKSAVEANLSLGLPIQDLPALQSKIERDRADEPNVRAIEIVGPNDIALYSTDRGAIGDSIPEVWRLAIEDSHQPTWVAFDRGEVAIGEAIVNDFEQEIGQVVLIVSQEQVTPATTLTLHYAALGWRIDLVMTGVATVACFLLMLYRERAIRRARAVWQGRWSEERSREPNRDSGAFGPSMETASRRARERSEEAVRALDQAKRRLMDLDDAV